MKKGVYQYDAYVAQRPPYDHEFRIISFFSEDGKQLTTEGTGRYIENTRDSYGEGRVVFGMKMAFGKASLTLKEAPSFMKNFIETGPLKEDSPKQPMAITKSTRN